MVTLAPQLKETRETLPSAPRQLRYTLKQIGKAIKNGSHYVPIIKHAQTLASRAGPKDYLGQIKQLYDDFTQRWRYVRDPVHLETLHTSGKAIYGQILGFDRADPREHGAGDCDDAAIYMGSALQAIGLPVRTVTTAPPQGSRGLFTHVFVQTKVPHGVGWYTVDPVGFPQHGPGWTPPHSRIAYWDLDGNLLGKQGSFPPSFSRMLGETEDTIGGNPMNNYQGLGSFPDQTDGLGLDWAGDEQPLDWATHGLLGFGAYASDYGIINGDETGLLMEFAEDDEYPGMYGVVRTKMLEMDPVDIQHVRQYGCPRMGAVALGDDGDVYQYTQDPVSGLGFFKKLFKKVGGAVKKGVKWVGGKAKKLIRKLPGGKYLVRLHDKIHKVAMRIAKPLVKYVGKYAKKLAPVAALIPGYGPAIAGALYSAGKIANIIKKTGVLIDKKTGKPKFKSGKQAKRFQRRLKKAAARMKRKMKGRRGRRKRFDKEDILRRQRAIIARARSGRRGRLLKAGTKAHRAYLRGLGLDVDNIDPSMN